MTAWEKFFNTKILELISSSNMVIDIGGGLRLSKDKSDRVNPKNAWLISEVEKIDYKIMDVVPEYNPDLIGDIHELPFENNSVDAFICLAVLEHVQNPIKAMEEMYRVLRPGGKIIIYVPFLFYYHNHEGNHEYGDYWRFTKDTLQLFAKPFSSYEIQSVKQPIETLISLSPFVRLHIFVLLARKLDTLFYKRPSNQTSGYYMYLIK